MLEKQKMMKKGTKSFLMLSIFALGCLQGISQQVEKTEYKTPYELMSSYYNSGNFNPFAKKNWYLGVAFSLDDQHRANTKGIIQNVINGDNLKYNVQLKGGYYSGDYNMIGLNLGYFQNGFEGVIFQDPDTIQSNSLTRGYTIVPNLRTSFPLTASQRFSFFVELDLAFSYSTTLSRQTQNIDDITKTYTEQLGFGVGVSPGITFFAMEAFAFELQLNVVGYNFNITDTDYNGLEQSRDIQQKVNLDLKLVTLELGLAYYFGANK
jgi:hypothetical protein